MILKTQSFVPSSPEKETGLRIVLGTKILTEYKLNKHFCENVFKLRTKALLDMYGLTVVRLKRRIASYDVVIENIFVIERMGSVV